MDRGADLDKLSQITTQRMFSTDEGEDSDEAVKHPMEVAWIDLVAN